ncbi:cilia- and flagella-associated protein 45, partial [Clarias magur]
AQSLATSSSSSASTRLSSNGCNTRRYRVLAPNSQVDETLFGKVKQAACERKSSSIGDSRPPSISSPDTKTQKSKPDLSKRSRIPNKEPSGLSIILCQAELERIMGQSRVLTKEERETTVESQRKAREQAADAAEKRKVHMEEADLSRQKNQALSDLETAASERAQYLLERANTLRMEQEDEVKKLNELILGVQCHAMRDTQIEEKKQILSELHTEELRLDAMMEADRQRALEAQEQIDELRKNQRLLGKTCILKQIEDRQEERMLQEMLKEQEAQQMLEKLERLQMEELEAMEKKKEEQNRIQLEIQKINEENLIAKERRKEEERQADINAMQYTQKKMEREAEYEAEQTRLKKEKEKEVARLRALQERDRDLKSEQDAVRARRNQEAAEREWRRKEKEQTQKKLEEAERLKAERREQITQREHMLSIQAGRERAEFERVLRVQQELIKREKEKEEQHRQQVLRHADGVRQQVREREAQVIAQRRERYREGEKLDEEARIRRARLDEIKEKKLKEL